jgi:hypothetical protein
MAGAAESLTEPSTVVSRHFFTVWIVIFLAAILLEGLAWELSYYTALAIENQKCAGRELVAGYRIRIDDLFGFPLIGLGGVAMIVIVATDKRTSDWLRILDLPIARLGSLQITYGMFLIGGVLFGALGFLGVMDAFVVGRYDAVVRYCVGRNGVW